MFKKNEIALFLGIVFVATLFLFGCSTVTSTASSAGSNFFPHADGYSWQHQEGNGSMTISTFEGTATVGSIIVQILNNTYMGSNGDVYTSEAYYRVTDSGVYLHGYPASPTTEGLALLQFPLEEGREWEIRVSDLSKARVTVAGREWVTVPAGRFDCYKLKYVNFSGTVETSTDYIWIGDGVGKVKMTTSNSTWESELAWKNF